MNPTTKDITDGLARRADPSGKLAAYLAAGSYYTDPASVGHHRNYPGGLADHCLGVYLNLRALGVAETTAALVALGHDLCKVGTYQRVVKSQKVKDEAGNVLVDFRGNPRWEDVPAYEYLRPEFPLGHGDSSLFRFMGAVQGSGLDAGGEFGNILLAIRWHMGMYGCAAGEEQRRIGDAMTMTPLVILAQTADLLDTYHGRSAADLVAWAAEWAAGEATP